MLVFIAIALRWVAGAAYIRAVIAGKAKPHVISWFFWGFTALIAFFVQLSQGAGRIAWVSLALAVGPILVFSLAIAKGLHRIQFTITDKFCVALTLLGIGLWLTTSNPLAALWMSVAVDFISSIPTIVKCYRRPHTEHMEPYAISMISMCITLASVTNWSVSTALFPVYILGINGVFVGILTTNLRVRVRRIRRTLAKWQTKQLQPSASVDE